eukprot:jgi/Mesen1/9027/ME000565S08341
MGHEYDMGPEEGRKARKQKKTPEQRELLESAYQEHKYPSDAIRQVLAEQTSLTDKQLQMWFVHRRRKDRKDDAPAPGAAAGTDFPESVPAAVLAGETGDMALLAGREEEDYDDQSPACIPAAAKFAKKARANAVGLSRGDEPVAVPMEKKRRGRLPGFKKKGVRAFADLYDDGEDEEDDDERPIAQLGNVGKGA